MPIEMTDFVSFVPTPTETPDKEFLEGIREETKGQSEYSLVNQDESLQK